MCAAKYLPTVLRRRRWYGQQLARLDLLGSFAVDSFQSLLTLNLSAHHEFKRKRPTPEPY